ncbi:MAG: aspartyl-phosphate phosphatase Spo0E family protein [Firmicutes bacterium]|nr:aspartyl-phosphate phosphatase Spo0E family protein [Bacillota bacterium]
MNNAEINGEQNIKTSINKLRLKLNRTYEKDGLTEEVSKISQELDKYIALVQKELLQQEKVKRKES